MNTAHGRPTAWERCMGLKAVCEYRRASVVRQERRIEVPARWYTREVGSDRTSHSHAIHRANHLQNISSFLAGSRDGSTETSFSTGRTSTNNDHNASIPPPPCICSAVRHCKHLCSRGWIRTHSLPSGHRTVQPRCERNRSQELTVRRQGLPAMLFDFKSNIVGFLQHQEQVNRCRRDIQAQGMAMHDSSGPTLSSSWRRVRDIKKNASRWMAPALIQPWKVQH